MKQLITIIIAFVAAFSQVNAQYYQMGNKLTEPSLASNSGYGFATTLSSDGYSAMVGVPSMAGNTGGVYFYYRVGLSWYQGGLLTANDAAGAAYFGQSVAISADGNTAIIGGPGDNNDVGAAWIFVRSGNTWTQQGGKLVGSGPSGTASQGFSVSISGDGNMAISGGYGDNNNLGAVWVYNRTGTTWQQMGTKLVGAGAQSNASYPAWQGYSVDISDNANRIIIGAPGDNAGHGAAWIFSWVNSSWVQEGSKLTGPFLSYAGASVAVSADGSRVVLGAPGDNNHYGFAAVMVRDNSGNWTQEGSSLIGTFPVGNAQQGGSVAISADGQKVVVGGGYNFFSTPNTSEGQLWVFQRQGNTWTPEGNKIVGTGSAGNAQQGASVAISGDAQTIMTGGYADDNYKGAVWLFNTDPAVGIKNTPLDKEVVLYPNPASESITFNVAKALQTDTKVTICDVTGHVLVSEEASAGTKSLQLDISSLSAGLYLFNISSGGVLKTSKFIKK